MSSTSNPGDRLERALAVFLNGPPTTPAEANNLLEEHPDLRDLLEPMVGGRIDSDPRAEERVLGDFRLVRELGRGGMGVVYEAWQRSLDRRVAVKVLAPALVASPTAIARFRREAGAAGRLRHPNLVEVYGFGSEEGQHFFAMQLVDGASLHACKARFAEPRHAVELAVQLMDALAHAHSKGLVHRDVKPANILVQADRTPMLTDFGIASDEALPSLTCEGGFLGTLDYASPEQVRGEPIDARTDVWAAGVILHELLAGCHPFAAATQEATLKNILTVEPSSLRHRPGVSGDLAAVVGRALEKSRARRYASAAAMLADLRALQTGAAVSARLPTPPERVVRWARREPWQAMALGILALGLAAAGSLLVLANHRADENATLAAAKAAMAQRESTARQELAGKMRDFDLLAGVVLYERAVQRQETLYPAWPKNIPALEGWLRDCGKLEQLRPQIERGIDSLREHALPRTPDQVDGDRRQHPDFAAWQTATWQLGALDRAAAIRDGKEPLQLPEVPPPAQALPLTDLNQFAWERVAPQPAERKFYGQEALALACARQAAAQAADTTLEAQVLDTLAWALLANGQDDEAVRSSDAALQKAKASEVEAYRSYRTALGTAIAERGARRAALAQQLAKLAPGVEQRRTYRFADDAAQFLHDTLVELLGKLDLLFAHEKEQVQQRLAWAQRLAALTLHHPNARVTWETAREAIAAADDVVASHLYRGQSLPLADDEVLGLVPIGMNPRTRLWEFYDLRSAWDGVVDPATIAIPQHDAAGNIAVGDDTGMVFVLLPGGLACIGSQTTDPTGPNYDPEALNFTTPVQQVELWPFFLARHEMTQGQWARLYVGDEGLRFPSGYPVGFKDDHVDVVTLAHPVTRVSWSMADRLLRQQGLDLPTEAQWEYACRAGTWTPYWSGKTGLDLEGVANVDDISASRGSINHGAHEPFDDGHQIDAPVDSFRPNPFGLFSMHGNVGEWCVDAPSPNSYGFRAGDGARLHTDHPDDRTSRSGSYQQEAQRTRSSLWVFGPKETRAVDLGLRAARLLRRP